MYASTNERRRASSPIRGSFSNASPINSPPRRFSSPNPSPSSRSIHYSDRHIPSRSASSLENSFERMTSGGISNSERNEESNAVTGSENRNARFMNSLIRAELLGERGWEMGIGESSHFSNSIRVCGKYEVGSPNVLRYRSSEGDDNYPKSAPCSPRTSFRNLSSSGRLSLTEVKKSRRRISRVPYKVLDAPDLQDDFYLNLIDWSANNILAVGLGSSVYLWSAYTSKVTKLYDFGGVDGDSVTSVVWMGGTHLVVGMNSGSIQVWDTSNSKCVREMEGHTARVGTLAWCPQSCILASGSRDRKIFLQDVKVKGSFNSGRESRSSVSLVSPYRSCHSGPLPLYNSREEKINSVFDEANTIQMSSYPAYKPFGHSVFDDVDLPYSAINDEKSSGYAQPTNGHLITDETSSSMPLLSEIRDDGHYNLCVSNQADTTDEMLGGCITNQGLQKDKIDATLIHSKSPPPTLPHYVPSISVTSTPIRYPSRQSHPATSPSYTSSILTSGPCKIRELLSHKQEVCGLKWSFDEKQLASGGNDNKLLVWNISGTGGESRHGKSTNGGHCIAPEFKFCEHTAAVKAIAWSPHQTSLLASGGGTADRTIRFWNTSTGAALNHVDTGSQVCNIMWSTHVNEIVSTHGYSLNQIAVWRYPCMQKVATLTGHTYRVLYLAMSPDGQSIVTGAGDETLRFWNVFPGQKMSLGASGLGSTILFPSGGDIR